MHKIRMFALAVTTALSIAVSPATGQTVTFAGLPTTPTPLTSYTENGVTVTGTQLQQVNGGLYGGPATSNGQSFSFSTGGAFTPQTIDLILQYSTSSYNFQGYDQAGNPVGSNLFFLYTSGTVNLSSIGSIYRLGLFFANAPGSVDNFVIQGDAPAGVPEPASWALLVAGFGAVGIVMRRRVVPDPVMA